MIGGTSFIGRNLVARLALRGIDVEATARSGADGLRLCDMADLDTVRDAVGSGAFDAIVNCTGATATDDPATLYRVHVLGAVHLITAAAELAPRSHVLLLGSAAEYGRVPAGSLPVGEDFPPAPLTYFGVSKLAQTELARVAAQVAFLRITVLRPFNVLGPGLPAAYFAGAFARALRAAIERGEAGAVPVRNAAATRDFVDVGDVAEAIIRAMLVEPAPEDAAFALLNIASGTETPILEVAARLCQLAGPFEAVPGGSEVSRSAIDRSCGDATRLMSRTGWRPTIPWEQSVDSLWEAVAAQP